MMKDLDVLLQEELVDYEGHRAEWISQIPALARLLNALLGDPRLPPRFRPLLLATLGYFTLSTDIISEDLEGPYGYVDDLFLCAFAVDKLRAALHAVDILEENWDGDRPIVTLIDEVLAAEKEIIGDRRDLILWYVGFEYMSLQAPLGSF